MAGLGAVPEWAPPNENHLLRSSSVVQDVSYFPTEVVFSTFDDDSREVLRLNFAPSRVMTDGVELPRRRNLAQPGWMFDESQNVLGIHHYGGRHIRVLAGGTR